jgi:hypothetical protein
MTPVTPTDLDHLAPLPRLRLSAEVFATYLRVRRAMRREDAKRAVRDLRAGVERPKLLPELAGENETFVAWRLAQAMEKVLSRLPSDSRCLFSSLTLICLLQRRGIDQVLVIAVRPQPFGAHAWVEVGGEEVLPGADPGYERILEL